MSLDRNFHSTLFALNINLHLLPNRESYHTATMESISETDLIERFDKLVAENVIVYGPNTKQHLTDEGYPV
jgi:hypothetical protein